MIVGAIIGAVASYVVFCVGNICSQCNCIVDMFNCQGFEGGSSFTNLLWFCVIGGAIIGLIFGICLAKADRDEGINASNLEIERRQGIQRAGEIKKKAASINIACNENKLLNRPFVFATYIADSQMSDIMNELVNMAELQGKVDALAEELSKGGVAK